MTEETGTETTPPEVIVQRGLYLDELRTGVVYAHRPGRTLTEADNVLFTTLTMNTQSLHLDAAFAAEQEFGKPLMNSMLTLSTLVGLSVAQISQGTIIGQLGLSDVSFPHPMFHGDTLYAQTEIVSTRESKSRPGQGIAVMAQTGKNQDGVVVAKATRTCLMWANEAAHQGAKNQPQEA